MKNIAHLDVLVVYSAYAATSASSVNVDSITPFSLSRTRKNYDNAYSYFLESCRKIGLKAGFTTSADVVGAGVCRSYWVYKNKAWFKVLNPGSAKVVFDKFSPFNTRQKGQRDLMFSSSRIKPFNEPGLYQLFFDKHATYKSLFRVAIPTVIITSVKSINKSVERLHKILEAHPNSKDFGCEYILKDRHGSAGQHVYHVRHLNQIEGIMKLKPKMRFILQPMVEFDGGYGYKGIEGRIEIRLIFMAAKVVQTYIRIAPANGFRCNENQGGSSMYINVSDVPKSVLNEAYAVVKKLPPHNSLYALDFLVSNNGNPYLLEGNTGPGLCWDPGKLVDEKKSQQLIRMIVSNLEKRVNKPLATRRYTRSVSPIFPIESLIQPTISL